MKTIEINLYSFNELSDTAKEKVLDKMRHINVEHYDWYESTIDYWKDKLHEEGFEDAEIYFSGFWSQGDGACFDAKINVEKFISNKRMLDVVKNTDVDFRIVKNSYANHYSHEKTRFIDYNQVGKKNIDKALAEIDEAIETKRLSLCHEIYNELEKEYKYLTSDEAIIETIHANDYTFEEDGTMRNH